jgi:hypothetical protein
MKGGEGSTRPAATEFGFALRLTQIRKQNSSSASIHILRAVAFSPIFEKSLNNRPFSNGPFLYPFDFAAGSVFTKPHNFSLSLSPPRLASLYQRLATSFEDKTGLVGLLH